MSDRVMCCALAFDLTWSRETRIAWAKVTPRCDFYTNRRQRHARCVFGRAPASEPGPRLALCHSAQTRCPCGTRSRPTYGCFLPDLTRFMALRRAGPDRQHRLTRAVPRTAALGQGFNPAVADCGLQGTASSPSSTTSGNRTRTSGGRSIRFRPEITGWLSLPGLAN